MFDEAIKPLVRGLRGSCSIEFSVRFSRTVAIIGRPTKHLRPTVTSVSCHSLSQHVRFQTYPECIITFKNTSKEALIVPEFPSSSHCFRNIFPRHETRKGSHLNQLSSIIILQVQFLNRCNSAFSFCFRVKYFHVDF